MQRNRGTEKETGTGKETEALRKTGTGKRQRH